MFRIFSSKRIIGSILFDIIGTLLALVTATSIRLWLDNNSQNFSFTFRSLDIRGNWPGYIIEPQVFLLIFLIWPVIFSVFSVYDGRKNLTLKAELLNVFFAIIASVLILAGMLFLTYRGTSRGMFFLFAFLDLSFLLSGRAIWWTYRRSFSWKFSKTTNTNVLIIGAGVVGQKVVHEFKNYAAHDIDIVGFVDDRIDIQHKSIAGLPVLGNLNQIIDIVHNHKIQAAVVALPLRAHEKLVNICQSLQTELVRVYVIPDLFAFSFPSASLDGFGGIPVIDLGKPGLNNAQRTIKRILDVSTVALGLLLISPFLFLIAILIKLDSPGPVFYKQTRIGESGLPFTMYKFRSMKVNNDSNIHQAHVARLIKENISPDQLDDNHNGTLKIELDPRVTKVGSFIRKTSIDELPQLFNVLRGEMSLVGPRPPLPYEVEIYQDWHKRRLEAPPGITGLWQVKARNQVSFDEMVRMDINYIENYSLWLDVKLILQTPHALLTAKGAG